MEYRLEELFDLQMGKTPSRDNPDYWGTNDHKWVSIADLSKCGKYIEETKECLSDVAIKESGISVVPANTVIMSFKLSIGKTAITPEPMYTNEAIMSFRDKHIAELEPDYVYYLFLGKDWDSGTNKAVMGKTLNKATLSKIRVSIHPIDKQREIVKVLDKMSNLVDLRKRQLEYYDNLIKARFVELFENDLKHAELTIGDIAEEATVGIANSATHAYSESGIVMLRNQNIRTNYLDDSDLIYITPEFASKYKKKALKEGDILITRTGVNIGMACIVPSKYEGCQTFTTLILRLKREIGITSEFVCYYINSPLGKGFIDDRKVGGAQPNFGAKQLITMPIVIPDINKQKSFASFVKQVDKSKVVVQQALDKTQLLFDKLMQDYFG